MLISELAGITDHCTFSNHMLFLFMGVSKFKNWYAAIIIVWPMIFFACTSSGNKNSNQVITKFNKGSYGFDVAFFAKNKIN